MPGESSMVGRVRRVLAIPAFRRLWMVTFLCSTADWLALLAVADLVAATSDNYTVKNFAFSGVVLSNFVPGLLFAPVGGLLADRFDRRTIMVVGDVVRCALLLSIVVTDLPWWPFVATFLVSSVAMSWIPAKDAAVPNLLRGPEQVETANQLGMVMTFGIAVIAGGGLYALTGIGPSLNLPEDILGANGTIKLAIGIGAVFYLASAVMVARRIPELSRRGTVARRPRSDSRSDHAGIGAMVRDVGRFVRTTPVVRGLIIGAFGAFAAGGAVIGSAQSYASSLLAGQAGFGLLFAAVFLGLTLGMIGAPRFASRLAHERLFGVAIVLAGLAMVLVALSPHIFVSLAAVVLVGACAGAAFLTGVTIIGTRVQDDVRGRVNAIYQSLMKVVLGSALAVVPVLVGLTRPREVRVFGNDIIIDGTQPVLLGAAILAGVTGVLAYRQMDDRRPEPILADLRNALRRHPRRGNGIVIAVEGTSSVDLANQTADLADWLRVADGRRIVVAADLALDDPRLAAVMSGASLSSARARVLAAAAVRADIVEREVQPVLDAGGVAIIERMVGSPLEALSTTAELDAHDVAVLADWATGRLRPDITVLLDRGGEADQAMLSPGQEHWRIRQLLDEMAASNPSRYLVIEVDEDPARTQAQLRQAIGAALPTLLPRQVPDTVKLRRVPTFEEITRHHDNDPSEDPWVIGPPAPETITIVPYDPEWPRRFQALSARIRATLGDAVLSIEHVGSTSVEGLAAKDVIDINLTVADPRNEDDYIPALERLGYVHTIREPSFHQHRCLRYAEPRVNLHVYGPDCPEVIRTRMFRDWLRAHPEDRARYEDAKRAAIPGGGHVMDYNARKQEVIREIYDRLFRAAGML